MSGFNPALTIRIFRFQHTSTDFEVIIPSHGPEVWETVLICNYLLYVHYLWS